MDDFEAIYSTDGKLTHLRCKLCDRKITAGIASISQHWVDRHGGGFIAVAQPNSKKVSLVFV